MIVDPEARCCTDEVTLRTAFRLTAAEARVASRIGRGWDPLATAQEQNVSVQSVRTHLKVIFEKTGARRQSELSSFVTRLTRPGDRAR